MSSTNSSATCFGTVRPVGLTTRLEGGSAPMIPMSVVVQHPGIPILPWKIAITGVEPSPGISVALSKTTTTDSHKNFVLTFPYFPLSHLVLPLPCAWESRIVTPWLPCNRDSMDTPGSPPLRSWSDNSISEVPLTSTKVSRSRNPGWPGSGSMPSSTRHWKGQRMGRESAGFFFWIWGDRFG